jgi:hypothetical protein
VKTDRSVNIEAFPLEDVRGVRQLLKVLRYYQGSTLAADERPFTAALSRFQSENSPCMYGVMTKTDFVGCLVITCGVGGLKKTPPEELGLMGPVTRKVISCVAGAKQWPARSEHHLDLPRPQ